MTTINVQFSDSSDEVVVSYFASPQDGNVWPNQGEIDTGDSRWKAYYDTQPEPIKSLLPAPTN
jgi:hypothetical protein